MADPIIDMRWAIPAGQPRRPAQWLVCAPLMLLCACHPAKTVDFYRDNPIERDKMVNNCLATGSDNWDCVNAITAEAERWGTKDIDGFTVVISGDGPAPATATPAAPTPASSPPHP